MQKKTRTPCVGICSTTYGDEVCRGCKRFYFEVINWNKYDEDEKDAIWMRLESLKTQIIYSKIKKIKFSELANLIAYSSPVGIFLGRLANFVNAELVGRPTDGTWGVLYRSELFARHPSQLYEALFEGLILFFILHFFLKSNVKDKINGYALFLIFYSFFRFSLEFFREPDSHLGFIINNISMGQVLTFPMFIIGIIFLRNEKKL